LCRLCIGQLADANAHVNSHLLPKDSLDGKIGKRSDCDGNAEAEVETFAPSAPVLECVSSKLQSLTIDRLTSGSLGSEEGVGCKTKVDASVDCSAMQDDLYQRVSSENRWMWCFFTQDQTDPARDWVRIGRCHDDGEL
jgi:hypothetical protein